jgi:hypothetical protein
MNQPQQIVQKLWNYCNILLGWWPGALFLIFDFRFSMAGQREGNGPAPFPTDPGFGRE